MALVMDPEANEIRALQRVANWRGKRVLEIGCGDGRLTLRMARLGAAHIHAVDTDAKLIRDAKTNLPRRYAHRILYRVGDAEQLAQPAQTFDLVLFSWAL